MNIPVALVDRHLRLFSPQAWVNGMIEQGLQGLGAPPVWYPAWWDFSKTAQSMVAAFGRLK